MRNEVIIDTDSWDQYPESLVTVRKAGVKVRRHVYSLKGDSIDGNGYDITRAVEVARVLPTSPLAHYHALEKQYVLCGQRELEVPIHVRFKGMYIPLKRKLSGPFVEYVFPYAPAGMFVYKDPMNGKKEERIEFRSISGVERVVLYPWMTHTVIISQKNITQYGLMPFEYLTISSPPIKNQRTVYDKEMQKRWGSGFNIQKALDGQLMSQL